MKTGFFAAVLIVGLAVFLSTLHYATANNAPNTTPTFATSRFLMLSGTYTVAPDLRGEAGKNENGVFRIDTYTGKVWKLNATVDPEGRRSEKWVPIEDKQP